ncbi:homoserine kinase [Alteromonadaceae bacterium M269]|nr:homoserine kinase [Alteromonadaceae bacterium M269]
MTIRAYAPASIGNVGLGFDILGAALKPIDGSLFGDEVELSEAREFRLNVKGKFADKLPSDANENIVTQCYRGFCQYIEKVGKSVGQVEMTLTKSLPIGSGLGSSASSIVATLNGLNKLFGEPLNKHELLLLMGELEGKISGSVHYDNVAPSYLGGLTLMTGNEETVASNLPVFDDWYWLVCYSGISVSTSAAREILPSDYSMATALTFGRQLAVFTDALHRGDRKQAAAVMNDVIAEAHRKSLLPGFDEAKQFALQNGASAFGISGSGPTVFCVGEDLEHMKNIESWLQEHYVQNEFGFSHICVLDTQGSTIN